MRFFNKSSAVISVAVVLFLIDRILKNFFLAWPDYHLKLVADWFGLRLAVNQGIAFGLPFVFWPLIVITGVIILILFGWVIKAYQAKNQIIFSSLVFIILGAGSNFIDRWKFSVVIDYFDLKYFTIFNLADVMISFGVICLLADIILSKKENKQAVLKTN